MKCNKCGSEWATNNSVTICPFCNAPLSIVVSNNNRSFTASADVLKYVYETYGADIFLSSKLKSYVSDLAPQLPMNIKNLIGLVNTYGASDKLKVAHNSSVNEQEIAFQKAISCLTNNFISEDMAQKIIYEMTSALGWSISYATTLKSPSFSSNTVSTQNNSILSDKTLQIGYSSQSSTEYEYSQTNSYTDEKIAGNGWEIIEKTMYVSSLANLPRWYDRKNQWNNVETLIFSEGITEITMDSFAHMENLQNISFPPSLKKIGLGAFERCDKLTKIELPYGLQTISSKTFQNCLSLNNVNIPDTVKYIGDFAFVGCHVKKTMVNSDCVICNGNPNIINTPKQEPIEPKNDKPKNVQTYSLRDFL